MLAHGPTLLKLRKTVVGHLCLISAATLFARAAHADVIVLANRTGRELPVRFMPVKGVNQSLTLRVGENLPLFLDGKANVSFSSPGGSRIQLLDANCAYFFGPANGRIEMQRIGLGEDGTLVAGHELPGSASRAPAATIPVKILVDEEEPARRAGWENRLRRRVDAASAILDKYFHVKLQVVAVGTWNSDNGTHDFHASLSEFEREVSPSPARLAIGFSSQWKMVPGRVHMAGTRGPLHTHILAREGNPEISEPEKLEYLIHELGHYLGAAHSPERGSVMRPVLGDNQAGRRDFRIQFDPVNTLTIAMISEEMRRRNLKTLAELSPETKKRLGQIYMELARSLPDDPAAFHYAQLVRSDSGSPVVAAARQILQQIVRAAVENRALPLSNIPIKDVPTRRQGDELTNYLIREAARAASSTPVAVRQEAFLLAVTIGLGDSQVVSPLSTKASVLRAIEAPSERAIRLAVLGEPTMRGRRDLAQHFLSAAQLAATNGIQAAQTAGLAKELADSQGISGFSFADVAADRAGVRFAQAVLEKRIALGALAVTFSVPSYVPEIEGLSEKVPAKELAMQFGGKDDPRFLKQLQAIDQRLSELPGYRPATPVFSR